MSARAIRSDSAAIPSKRLFVSIREIKYLFLPSRLGNAHASMALRSLLRQFVFNNVLRAQPSYRYRYLLSLFFFN